MLRKAINISKRIISKGSAIINYHAVPVGRVAFPRSIAFSVNNICNLRCIMCDIGQQNMDNEFYKNLHTAGNLLQQEDYMRFVDEVAYFRPAIAIHSTEPLLYKGIVDLSEYIINKGLDHSITTNGLLLENFAEALVDIGLPSLNVSIDGPPAIHNRIRGVNNSFEKAYAGIEKIIGYRRKQGKKLPAVNIAATVLNLNVGALEELTALFAGLGVNSIHFTHYNFINDQMASNHNCHFGHLHAVSPSSIGVINPDELDTDTLLRQIAGIRKKYPRSFANFTPEIMTKEELETYYRQPGRLLTKRRCTVPWTNVQLLATGDLVPAARCFHYVYGNIRDNSFRDIWYGEKAQLFRREMKKCGATPACSRCCGLFSSI